MRANPLPRRHVLQAGTVVLLLGARELAFGASIVAVRVWPAPDYTRVTLESDTALQARHFVVQGPDRLVVDIEGLELSPTLRDLVGKVRADDPFIAGVRVGQNQPRVVRLVVDLKQPILPQVFTLPPIAAYQHRLVFDLYPTQEIDPLLALIRDKERAMAPRATATAPTPPSSTPAAGSATAADPLGELMAQRTRPGSAGLPSASPTTPAPSPTSGSSPRPPAAPMTAAPPAPVAPPAAAAPAEPIKTDRLITVALDPGHGGEDPGAVGPSGLREKDVVLRVAQLVRDRINAEPNMRAMLTRDGDFFVPLAQRVRKAQRVRADLFVSIHADAFFTPTAGGASVFALSERGASSSAARWMADKENGADRIGGINVAVRDAQVAQVMGSMAVSAQIQDSLRAGNELLGELSRLGRLHKPRVEQAGFAVLKAPDIPSVLVETAFISNPAEEARLADPAFQERLAEGITRGIKRYFARNPPLARGPTS
jgi:N-acetylmuramoyl-L-alanine amidase